MRSFTIITCLLFLTSGGFGDSIVTISPQPTRESALDSNTHKEYYAQVNHPIIQGFKQFSLLGEEHETKKHNSKRLRDIINKKKPKLSQKYTQQSPQEPQDSIQDTHFRESKPKVLLIMDDLHDPLQLKRLLALDLNITPSLFPPTKYFHKTPQMAQNLVKENRVFMLHLPLEALNFEQKELSPIKVGTSLQTLRDTLTNIKRNFPELVYINNHTGSKFTQSRADMENLLAIFDELDFKFIDSVTTSKPISEAISREQNRLIMQRDIFLDNAVSTTETKSQLKHLISTAQKNGYAIAICHPHPSTFKALRDMQGEILSSVDLISPFELESHLNKQEITQYTRHKYYAKQ